MHDLSHICTDSVNRKSLTSKADLACVTFYSDHLHRTDPALFRGNVPEMEAFWDDLATRCRQGTTVSYTEGRVRLPSLLDEVVSSREDIERLKDRPPAWSIELIKIKSSFFNA